MLITPGLQAAAPWVTTPHRLVAGAQSLGISLAASDLDDPYNQTDDLG